MENLYTNSNFLSNKLFSLLEKTFDDAWSKETACLKDQVIWSEKNKALGQCAVTALIVQDIFGGELISSRDGSHFWNELPDGSQQDLSRKQFKSLIDFKEYRYVTRNEILDSKGANLANTRRRYLKLRNLFTKVSNSFSLSSV